MKPNGLKGDRLMIVNDYKEAYFNEYCHLCVHCKKAETEDPCYECLENSFNLNSHKPVNYEEK